MTVKIFVGLFIPRISSLILDLPIFLILKCNHLQLEAVPVDGNVEVMGSDIDVVGETAVEATLPTSGNVGFNGQIHAKGSVKIMGSTCM